MTHAAAGNREEHNVVNGAIHRIIEYHAASRPDAPAVTEGAVTLSYRELNQRANTLARRLADSGLTRGALALVRMERGANLATVLLAVLKAGAAYAWMEPGTPDDLDLPAAFCIVKRPAGSEQRYLAVDIRGALAACDGKPTSNLPILTRGSDVACAFVDASGEPHLFVPHATITSLTAGDVSQPGEWGSAPGAFELWLGLMSGATITLPAAAPATAAA